MKENENKDVASTEQPDEGGMGWIIGLGVAALALAGWMGWEFYTAAGSLFWPTTPGVVKSLKVWEKTSLNSGSKNFQIEIVYDYAVGGKTYTGTLFNSRNNHIDQSDIPSVQRQYAVGAACTVTYSRLFKSQSVLVPELSATAWLKFGIAVLALIGAVFLLVIALKKPQPAK